MDYFIRDNLEMFLGAVRKYMQVRGPLSQKELAEQAKIGVSTLSRFLNQQTKELNPQMIAKIVATLHIPLHEIIDFVEEDYTEQFVRLVRFLSGDDRATNPESEGETSVGHEAINGGRGFQGGSNRNTQATITSGGRTRNLTFRADEDQGDTELRDKLSKLSLKQKGFLNEFLNLDSDGRDLVADVGRNIISYLRQKGIDF
jgi:transcriptional regulator with XRE-family HTH domain